MSEKHRTVWNDYNETLEELSKMKTKLADKQRELDVLCVTVNHQIRLLDNEIEDYQSGRLFTAIGWVALLGGSYDEFVRMWGWACEGVYSYLNNGGKQHEQERSQ